MKSSSRSSSSSSRDLDIGSILELHNGDGESHFAAERAMFEKQLSELRAVLEEQKAASAARLQEQNALFEQLKKEKTALQLQLEEVRSESSKQTRLLQESLALAQRSSAEQTQLASQRKEQLARAFADLDDERAQRTTLADTLKRINLDLQEQQSLIKTLRDSSRDKDAIISHKTEEVVAATAKYKAMRDQLEASSSSLREIGRKEEALQESLQREQAQRAAAEQTLKEKTKLLDELTQTHRASTEDAAMAKAELARVQEELAFAKTTLQSKTRFLEEALVAKDAKDGEVALLAQECQDAKTNMKRVEVVGLDDLCLVVCFVV